MREGFFHLGAKRLGFEDAGAEVGGNAELRRGGALVEPSLFFGGHAHGDAGSSGFLLAGKTQGCWFLGCRNRNWLEIVVVQ